MNNNESEKRADTVPASEAASNPFADAPVIFTYTRAQAIEDGVLIDLTEWAKETGFRYPVACTAAVWQGHIVPPEGTREQGQSERGRAHDLLWMLRTTIRMSPEAKSDRLLFKVVLLKAPHHEEIVRFKSCVGPGDRGEPVLTIMLPDED